MRKGAAHIAHRVGALIGVGCTRSKGGKMGVSSRNLESVTTAEGCLDFAKHMYGAHVD